MGRAIRTTRSAPRTATPSTGVPSSAARAAPIANGRAARCACGGGCPRCFPRTAAGQRLQAQRALGDAGDPLERQADRAADDAAAAPRIEARTAVVPSGTPEAPASVEQVLAGSASPLEHGLRRAMEQRFERDFSAVRVHRGAAAEKSAAEIGALAYTAGLSIVFGRGQYAPHSASGRRLIAHELAHVVQQDGAAQQPVQRDLAAPYQPDAVVARLTPKQTEAAITFNDGLFGMSSTMALVRDVINPTDTSDSALVAAVLRWQAWHGIAQDGQLNTATLASIAAELTAGQANLLRWAGESEGLDRPMQTAASSTLTAGTDGLETLPAKTRARVQAVTASVVLDQAEVERLFQPPSQGRAKLLSYTNMTELFGPGIPENAKAGLRSMAGYLMSFDATLANQSKMKALPTDATVNVEMSLWPYINLAGLFRFTRIAPAAGSKAGTADTLIIELITSLPPMNNLMPALVPALAGAFTVGGSGFIAGAGWRQDTSAVLLAALGLLPPAALAAAAGLTFVQDGAASDNEAGVYDPDTDTVRIHANAFRASNLRVGKSVEPVTLIAHEIGHALDLRPLMLLNADGTRSARREAQSLSGTTWVNSATLTNTVELGNLSDGTLSTAFRQAVAADATARAVPGTDSLKTGVTDYGEQDWQEAFAEAFMLYTTDPQLLMSIRPRTYAYFLGRYPSPAPAP